MAADECIGALEGYQDGGSCSRLGELLNIPLAIVGMKHLVEYNTREVEIFFSISKLDFTNMRIPSERCV